MTFSILILSNRGYSTSPGYEEIYNMSVNILFKIFKH